MRSRLRTENVLGATAADVAGATGGRELVFAGSTAAQSNITTVTDITDCSINFEVGDRPVYVIGSFGQIFSLTASCSGNIQLRDASDNTVLRNAIVSMTAAAVNTQGQVMLRIDTPGSYDIKLSLVRATGTGNLNINSDTTYQASIRAIEA